MQADAYSSSPGAGRARSGVAQRLMWVLWPGFLAAGVAETLFFACIDPLDLHPFAGGGEVPRVAIYTLGFFFFWGVAALSSALTILLASFFNGSPGRESSSE